MRFMTKLAAGSAAAALLSALAVPAMAQEITSEIRGTVTDAAGAPLTNATVTVVDTRTGQTRTTGTNAVGGFAARGLSVGGPFTVTVTADGFQGETLQGVFADLGQETTLAIDLDAGTADEVIVVTAAAQDVAQVALGPSASFGLDDLQNLPAINRDLRDVIRTDPRIFIDEGFVDAVQCAGANPRFNSLTVDGVRLNDSFGLNSNGFPTERQPFPFDAIEQVSVELSPIDVQYGGFTACNINAVTKSGSNEFSGTAFFDYTSDSLTGDSLEGEEVNVSEFDEIRYGAQLSGPIIPDRLFFSIAYEKVEGANTFDRGPEGSGAVNPVAGFTQEEFDEILRISQDVYGYNPGGVPTSFDNEDEKILARLDWLVTNDHRATFTFNYNDGFNFTESDGDADEFEYSNHLYERGAELFSYVGSLYSDWTDNFSTEVRVGYVDLDNRQISVGGTDFGEMQIGSAGGATIYIGGDDSRQSNNLDYTIFNAAVKGFYTWNNHLFTAGYERETLEIFNLFVQHTEGEYRFGSIADFEAGEPFRIEYANAPSGNPDDAAADWGYTVNTVYFQDEYTIPQFDLTLIGGIRYDWYSSDDTPPENDVFTEQYGFSNAQNLDGEGLLQPRFGLNWDATDRLTVRAGVGRYSGGNPNVWLSNTYSNNNTTQFTVRDSDAGIADVNLFDLTYVDAEAGTPGGPGYGIPLEMAEAVANGGRNFEINVLDPDFEIPSEWKYTLGATYLLDVPFPVVGGEYVINADLLYSDSNNSAIIERIDLEQVGTGPDGLPEYASPLLDAFALTNGTGNEAFNASISIQKAYDFGLDWTLGYAYSDAEDQNPMTSSVAFSNYNNRAFVDPNNSALATSNYNVTHRITMAVNYQRAFIGDYLTKASLFGQIHSGEPFSYGFSNANGIFGFTPFLGNSDAVLLYVPSGLDDPNVVFGPEFDTDAFFKFVNDSGLDEYKGGFAERNAFESDWYAKFDLRLEQEFPGLFAGHRTAAFLVVENLGNLINDDWGVLEQPTFPNTVGVVDARYDRDTDTFTFNEFNENVRAQETSRVGDVSLWSIRVGVKYDF